MAGNKEGESGSESRSAMQDLRSWVVEHKLRSVGTFWAVGLASSFAYNFRRPHLPTSVKLIHARIHAQALTLAALVGAAAVEYYEHSTGEKTEKYEKHF